jgi:hypothetical protein
MTKSTKEPAGPATTTPELRQPSWTDVAKLLVFRLGTAVPNVAVVWLATARH